MTRAVQTHWLEREMTMNRHRQSSAEWDYQADPETVSTGVTHGSVGSYGKRSCGGGSGESG